MSQRLTELMHAVLDDEASEADRGKLTRALDSNAELRARFEALRELHNALDNIPDVDPPPAFAAEVLARLPERRAAAAGPDSAGLMAVFRSSLQLRYAAAFVFGLALASIVHEIADRSDPGTDAFGMTGTMIDVDAEALEAATRLVAVEFPGVSGNIRFGRHQELAVLNFELESDSEISVVLPDTGHTPLVGFAWLDGESRQLQVDNRHLRIRLSGHHRSGVLLRNAGEVVPVQFHRNGKLVHEVEIDFKTPRD